MEYDKFLEAELHVFLDKNIWIQVMNPREAITNLRFKNPATQGCVEARLDFTEEYIQGWGWEDLSTYLRDKICSDTFSLDLLFLFVAPEEESVNDWLMSNASVASIIYPTTDAVNNNTISMNIFANKLQELQITWANKCTYNIRKSRILDMRTSTSPSILTARYNKLR